MGKGESAEATGEAEAGSETSTETTEQPNPESTPTPDAPEKSDEEKKKEVEKLQTVIKVDGGETSGEEKKDEAPAEETPKEEEKKESPPPAEEKKEEAPKPTVPKVPKAPQAPAAPAGGSRDDLEQRRNMLQSIKDFDFQIKKNQEDIGKMVEKLDGLTKDLDDLVSLYEIVSEQMNPFVGLSKVTKKRIDALENFTNEIEDIKVRMGDVESVVEKGVGGITRLTKKLDEKKITPESGDTANNLESELKNAEVQIDESSEETVAEPEIAELIPETPAEETIDTTSETEVEPEVTEPNPETPTEVTEPIPETPTEVEPEAQIIEPGNISSISMETSPISGDLSDDDLDILLSKSLESLLAEQNIDYLINDFLLSLK